MNEITMSLHKALAEKKNYGEKIEKLLNTSLIFSKIKSATYINGESLETINQMIQSTWDRINAYMNNYNILDVEIERLNNITEVTVNGENMTIADLIKRNRNIKKYKQVLLNNMKDQYSSQVRMVNKNNKDMTPGYNEFLRTLNANNETDKEKLEAYTETYLENNEWSLYDPLGLGNKIKKMEEEIADFKTAVDFTLSEINTTTFIKIKLSN